MIVRAEVNRMPIKRKRILKQLINRSVRGLTYQNPSFTVQALFCVRIPVCPGFNFVPGFCGQVQEDINPGPASVVRSMAHVTPGGRFHAGTGRIGGIWRNNPMRVLDGDIHVK